MEAENTSALAAAWKDLLHADLPAPEKRAELLAFAERSVNDAPRLALTWVPELIEQARLAGDPHPERDGYWLRSMGHHMLSEYDEAIAVLREGVDMALAWNDDELLGQMYAGYGGVYLSLGDFEQALSYGQQAMRFLKDGEHAVYRGWLVHGFGVGYFELGDTERARAYFEESLGIFEANHYPVGMARALIGLGNICHKNGQHKEAIGHLERAMGLFREARNVTGEARAQHDTGVVLMDEGRFDESERFLLESLSVRRQVNNQRAVSTSLLSLGRLYARTGRFDEAETAFADALAIADDLGVETRKFEVREALARLAEERGDVAGALQHYKAFQEAKERVFGDELRVRLSRLQIRTAMEQSEKEARWMRERNEALLEQNERLESLLAELRAAQEQLVQSEKMISLGQLTAGIAHEIKNPLNFVNNFAALSVELVDDLIAFMDAHEGDTIRATRDELEELLTDLRSNAGRIQQHGKRADRIVHGMLQHARGVSGEWREVDLNGLIEEYAGLAYHGARARDMSFNVTLEKSMDPAIGRVRMVPQDIGRVILNLLSNAFYAVSARKALGEAGYEPRVHLSTWLDGDFAVVRVEDNGAGVPETVQARIFDPFFTTKPPGEGTGLGLSLSYDIVTQGHRGMLRLDTSGAEGAAFELALPAGDAPS
ncbi:MAG: tetratricopeptide repeat protein [Rhodothermales bacterium]